MVDDRDNRIIAEVAETVESMLGVLRGATGKRENSVVFSVEGVEVNISLEIDQPWMFGGNS